MEPDEERVYAQQLFFDWRDHEGTDPFGALVAPWLHRAQSHYRTDLATGVQRLERDLFDGPAEERQDLVWELYALSRLSDVLLLAFQPPREEAAWAALWPAVTMDQYLALFTGLGMLPFAETAPFDPFLHEIVEVEQAEDPDEPVRVLDVVWPGLWLGPLLFGRAGVRVRAGARHARRGVADRSPLYWSYLRRHRPTVDLSQGWGHNSQWRTDFRLDFRAPGRDRVHVDGHLDIDSPDTLFDQNALLTANERRELLRHRCLLRTPERVRELAETSGWEREFYPFHWRAPLE